MDITVISLRNHKNPTIHEFQEILLLGLLCVLIHVLRGPGLLCVLIHVLRGLGLLCVLIHVPSGREYFFSKSLFDH